MLRLRALAALAALVASAGTWAYAGPGAAGGPTGPAGATPDDRKVSVRVGDHVDFAVDPGADGHARWRLDGTTMSTGTTWTFAPAAADVGRHVVTVTAGEGEAAAARRWDVRVTPPRLPRVAVASPADATVSVEVGRDVVLRFDARPATPGETVHIAWTVDGVPAGEGDTLRWHGDEPANVRARALAVGSFGAAVGRDWSILVRLPPTTTTLPPVREAERVEPLGPLPPGDGEHRQGEVARHGAESEAARAEPEPGTEPEALEAARPSTTTEPPREVARVEPSTTLPATLPPTTLPPTLPPPTLPPPPPPPPPPPTLPPTALASRGTERSVAGTDDEVRRLMDRYAAAWRNHDVGELRRIGQVSSDSQAADLERYFAKVEDLDVEVNIIDIRTDGDRASVRFTRRDRFRDPTGRLVTKESPPIEKRLVRAADGLRFEPGAR